jgi:hypothetical protein
MPKTQNIQSNSQRFMVRSAIGGVSDFSDRGILGSFKFASGLDIRKQTDSISCQQGLTAEGVGVITDLIYWLVPSSDGNVYGFGDTGLIYKRVGTTWTVVYTDSGKITGAAEWISDSDKYYLYWTVGTNLHRKEIPGNTGWTDVDADAGWPKTNLENVDWHTMKIADGELLICNGPYVAMVGYDESYTVEAVQVYPNELTKTIIERQGYAIIGTYQDNDSEKGALYSWKSDALNWIQRKDIPSKGINGMVDTELTLMQAGDQGCFFYSDIINVLSINSIHEDGQVNPDGVDIDDGLGLFGMWGGTNSGIYTLGRKRKNAPFVLNLDYPLTCDEIGSVKNLGSAILISYKNGATFGLKRVDSILKGTGTYYSLDLVAPKEFVRPLLWKSVVLRTKEMPTGASITLYYKIDKNGDWVQAKMQDNVSAQTTGHEAVFLIGAEGQIFEFKIVLTPIANESPEIFMPCYVNFE